MASWRVWQAISSALLVAFVVGWAIEGFDEVPGWAWIALIASGVTFAIELALKARDKSGRTA